ncbi:lactate/malate dehydrogenase [Butyriboletus roseoflavus]|nr:lactate/malate dehydrogenase [Butyriboletus roseoflavus]
MMMLFYFILLASLVHASSWFSSESNYAKWSHAELRTWLEHHNIKVPPSFDKPHLYDLVDANWLSPPSPLLTHVEAGRQWSLDHYDRALRAFEHIKDDSFDKWDESRLRAFLLEQGVVAPSGPREQLVLLAKSKYRAYTDAAALYSSLASVSASSAYAGATDAAHSASQCFSSAVAQATHEVTRAFDDTKDYIYSTWDDYHLRSWLEDHGIIEAKSAKTKNELSRLAHDYYRKATSPAWESWSDSYIEWLITHNLLKSTDTPSRLSLLSEMKKYYYNLTDNVWNTWEHYPSALDSIWGAWTDSDIHQWLSEHGYQESRTDVKNRKDLVDLINTKYSNVSAKVASYLVWPDARLRIYLRERGISENVLPTNRPGLLRKSDASSPHLCLNIYAEETRIRWVQTSTRAETIFARLKEIINSSVEAAEEKVAQIFEVLSGHPRDAARYASEKVTDAHECADTKKAHAWIRSSHKVDQAHEKAEEALQSAQKEGTDQSRSGGIGQPLSLLLKSNTAVTELSLYDIVNAPGVAVDLSHIATPAKVEGYLPQDDGLKKTLTGADVVIIPAGIPRKPGMTRDDLFKINAGIVRDLATGIATTAPKAYVLVVSNPVNSTVPIVAEVFKKHGVFDSRRIFGVTTLDVVRASTFVSEILGGRSLATSITVPVIGGHSGVTIVPLLSQSSHPLPSSFEKSALESLVHRIQFGGDEVVKAKDGTGSATLSMAYAGAEFAGKVIRALKGEKGIVAPTYVHLDADKVGGEALKAELGKDIQYFSAPVELGPNGVEKIKGLGKITDAEKALITAAIPELVVNIEKGVAFVEAPKL